MRIVILLIVLAVFFLFTALLSGYGKKADLTRRRMEAIKNTEREYGDEELKKPFAERVLKPMSKKFTARLKRVAGKGAVKKADKNTEKTEKMLRSAAVPLSAQEFTFIKSILSLAFLGAGVACWFLLSIEPILKLLILMVLLCIPVLGPKYWLRGRMKKRKEAIISELPDVMDLLVVSVEAGLGLDAAITRLYNKNKNVVLTELMGSVRDVQMGIPRKTSLKEMADRCDVKPLTTFATAIIQAEQLGVSVKNVLVTQSERLRIERRQRVQEKAAKAPIKMMLPTVGFIFPVIFIILLGPAAMSLLEAFK